MKRQASPLAALIGLTVLLSACGNIIAPTAKYAGYIYAQTNAATNSVVEYGRSGDGKLVKLNEIATGGQGSDGKLVVIKPGKAAVDPLFSNDSVVLTLDHQRLFVANAGSGSVSAFSLDASGTPRLIGSYPSGAPAPTSLSVSGNLLYVSHGSASDQNVQITGFQIQADGSLKGIPTASYAPDKASVITQIKFSPDARFLESVELMNGNLTLYPVQAGGTLGAGVVNVSAGKGPFGSVWLDDTHVLVADAMSNSVSSYSLDASGKLTPITSALPNNQKATCWLKITPDKQFVYAANTSSGSISVYRIGADASLSLVNGNTASLAPGSAVDFMDGPSSGPVDLVISQDGNYLYQQFSGLGVVAAYRIGADGNLTPIAGGDATGLPIGTEGLAGY
ncbi:hypothetical protein GCM10022631_11700 [Deinococcus rubellus]|uniref:Lactonase family protein n=1 Tax=Deinococcus rubellus TaxID=1889240 RepID=A0ABY5YD67_9DEIO|nr:lactonase family protein [Deinococcus rubellus]UWX62785.1 lactonase family protein [Deinococcus rubellus]